MPQDVVLDKTKGYFDISLTESGQLEVDDFFDTALLYSIYGEQRADESEVSIPEQQRGWIGNEGSDYENGSKIWLESQSRITRTLLNSVQDKAAAALKWFVEDEFAKSVDAPIASVDGDSVNLAIAIRRSQSKVITRSFELWNNTGIR